MACPNIWLKDPQILIKDWKEFFPFMAIDRQCTAAALNSFTRFGIYLGIALALVTFKPLLLLVGVAFMAFALGMWFYMEYHDNIKETFLDVESDIIDPRVVNGNYAPDVIGSSGRTEPTAANPFMNILMTEYTDSPLRYSATASDSGRVGSALDQYFDTTFNRDPGDVFQRTQGQRQFITMPSTSIPNDQESYMNWLYRIPGKTCKEGNTDVCNFNTGPTTYPWREMK